MNKNIISFLVGGLVLGGAIFAGQVGAQTAPTFTIENAPQKSFVDRVVTVTTLVGSKTTSQKLTVKGIDFQITYLTKQRDIIIKRLADLQTLRDQILTNQ